MRQRQFLSVVSEEEAHRRFREACEGIVPRVAHVPLGQALGRVLAGDVVSSADVPAFDRSNVDGFAVRAEDTFGASEFRPVRLRTLAPPRAAGAVSDAEAAREVGAQEALPIATGAALPRGAAAVVMVEHTRPDGAETRIERPATPGERVAWAGTDLGRGELVLRAGCVLGSRETGLLAAVGVALVSVFDRPRVQILSTGDEVRPVGCALRTGELYDVNQRMVADAARELGCEVRELGIAQDDEATVREAIGGALGLCGEAGSVPPDLLVLSGGTSKGAGDLNATVVHELAGAVPGSPGVVVHGVALKPGKPLCLAVIGRTAVAILPGFPTSAIFTFHELVAPLLRRLCGLSAERKGVVRARMPRRFEAARGRTHYVLVTVIGGERGPVAYPIPGGSGSVRTFARADGYVRIPAEVDYLEADEEVTVCPLGAKITPPDLLAIGSHCPGLDALLGRVAARGLRVRQVAVGSRGGLEALRRGEGDVAGIHLLDPASGRYNEPFLPPRTRFLQGWRRRQGIVFRRGDARFGSDGAPGLTGGGAGKGDPASEDLLATPRRPGELREPAPALSLRALCAPGVRMVNRNRGSGTRVLVDELLGQAAERAGLEAPPVPPGYQTEARTHHAVVQAVCQGRADWGVALEALALPLGLGFWFVRDECYDLAVREARWDAPAVRALREELSSPETATALRALGFEPAVR